MASDAFDTQRLMEEINSIPTKPSQKKVQNEDYKRLHEKQYEVLQKITKAHIDSFDFMLEDGLPKGIKNLKPVEMELPNKDRIKVAIIDVALGSPMVHKDCAARTTLVYPSECRMRGSSYRGKLQLTFSYSVNGQIQEIIEEIVGEIPIMLKTKKCNISKLSPKELVERFEDAEELGGYFVVNGKERVVRLLTAQRRNYPLALSRSSWKESGQLFSDCGISIRCVRNDQLGSNMILHYLTNGTARLRCFYRKTPIFLPIVMVLKSLCDVTDNYIYKELIKGKEEDTFYQGCIINMLRLVAQEGLQSHQQIKHYIGERFRIKCDLPSWYSNEEVAEYLLKECIATHLNHNEEKLDLLFFMTRKLFAAAKGECAFENPDNPMFHEISLSGHIYFGLLLERMDTFMSSVKQLIDRTISGQEKGGKGVVLTAALVRKCLTMKFKEITTPMEYLIATGNLQSRSGLGLMQTAGLSVMAEKINFLRFLSHFRAVHRGAFFAGMRTTSCRKLYPEAWGFLCPVHTPDGSPCGLLNHLAEMCLITNSQASVRGLSKTLITIGMEPLDGPPVIEYSQFYSVLLDGKVIGHLNHSIAESVVNKLRSYKASGGEKVPATLEIGFVPKTKKGTQYPGLYLFSTPSRMMRPVFNLETQTPELVGTFEQPYLDICVVQEEAHPKTTHQELTKTSILSVLAGQIPFPDFNQSPRNMYSCQMGKQTMGTPSHTLKFRSDTKMYSIVTPQSPLVRPTMHDHYHIDDYPYGTNAVVAVISYTGYDMEDALILNKASVERGFKHGTIFKTQVVNLRTLGGVMRGSEVVYVFGRKGDDPTLEGKLDEDGLPFIGNRVEFDDPICSYIDVATGKGKVEKYKSTEVAFISDVKLLGSDNGKDVFQMVAITYCIPRKPIIGDKFANRHGQKGVCSVLWPQENMPFTGSGITPDVIFNPHGFPSRMTIGMMIESMAGKTSSTYGLVHDATPFTFSEENTASEYYGELLKAAGYNYFGTERMYSGVDGRELSADIFIGVIYYTRLRHMVGDKFQVRSTGAIDGLTHQPVKGRKRGGGIRFGEMERDSLLAHGTSFLLQDRLFNQSDKSTVHACAKCGSIVSVANVKSGDSAKTDESSNQWFCRVCDSKANVKCVALPFVLKYLVSELASVNIKVSFDIK